MTDAEDEGKLSPVVIPTAPCRHLRNNGMYIYSDGQRDEPNSGYDNTVYWCLKTMKGYGPDDEMVAGPECRDPQRTCYQPF